jgi:hypothetical protein
MEHTTLLLTIIITSIFCNGWSIITDEGNVLYFIRKPFERAIDNLEHYQNRLIIVNRFDSCNKELKKYIRLKIFQNNIIYYIGKPFVLCITCYSSVWGASVFIAMNGISINTIPYLVINSVAAAFLNTLIYKHYVKFY